MSLALKLGVLADSSTHLSLVLALLGKSQHKIECSIVSSEAVLPLRTDIDAWVVSLEHHTDHADALISWLEDLNFPMAIADIGRSEEGTGDEYARRFAVKVEDCISHYDRKPNLDAPKNLWVLAASAGGPEAVRDFFSALPAGLSSLAFIYVQHIDEHALPVLKSSLQRMTDMNVEICEGSNAVEAGKIYIAKPSSELSLTVSGNIIELNVPWKGPYSPSVNQVVAKVASANQYESGAIFFSGMGDDGVESVRLLQMSGAKIWSQSADSCIVDSMPKSVLTKVEADFIGTPKELGNRLGLYLNNK
ncbi:MAG: chemosensory pili system protein ChpB (putative protein-glutamate methylesterase) [Flavobacteriales bacterium]